MYIAGTMNNVSRVPMDSPDGLEYTFYLRPGVKFHTTDYFKPTRNLITCATALTWTRRRDSRRPASSSRRCLSR